MLRLILVFALAGMAGIANAGDIYFYDLLKTRSTLGPGRRRWIRQRACRPGCVTKTGSWPHLPKLSIDAKTYSVSVLAIQHATNEGQAAVMFNADGSHAWAEIQEEGKPTLYLAKPSDAQKTALDNALAE